VPAALLTLLPPQSSRTNEPVVPMRAGDDGRFELRSATDTDELAVLATKPGYVDRWEHARRGARGVRIVLEPAGSIGGRVLLDASLGRGSVIVDAVPVRATEPDAPEAALRSAFLELDGSFVLSDLADGAYTVRAVYAATASVIGRIDGVKVENGRTLRDPRLDPFDLRASHRLIQLELCDARGDPLRDATCSVRPADEHSSLPVVTQASGGRAAFLFSGRPLDVTVSANGYLPARLERLSDSRRVTLQPAGILRLELARDPGLTSPLRLVARVAPLEGGPESPTLSRMGTFDAAGVLILETTFTGAARVDLQVVASHVRDPRMEPVTSRTIRLESQAREQVFRLDFDAAELSRAVEALRGER
jgi:hypothetical protein